MAWAEVANKPANNWAPKTSLTIKRIDPVFSSAGAIGRWIRKKIEFFLALVAQGILDCQATRGFLRFFEKSLQTLYRPAACPEELCVRPLNGAYFLKHNALSGGVPNWNSVFTAWL